MKKIVLTKSLAGWLSLALLLSAAQGLAQTPKKNSMKGRTLQTIRLHIDGFSKSKSGAI